MVDNEAFENGWWRQWLRSFGIGEEVEKGVSRAQLISIRVTLTRMRDENVFFETRTERGKIWVRRLTMEEWLENPRRKLM